MTNHIIKDQETTSRAIDGIDYGRRLRILARVGERLIIWKPGQPVWSGTGRPWVYGSSALYIHRPNGNYKRISHGGRLIIALCDPNVQRAIDGEFGEGFHKLLEPKATVVIGHDD